MEPEDTRGKRQMQATSMMRAPTRLRAGLEILMVAALYYLAARLGLLLAFQKTNATPVWAPSGIALAAVLLRGRGALAGVFLGALVANVQVFLQNEAAAPAAIAVVSFFIALGNMLEALAGALLLRRLVGAGDPFARAQDAFKFVGVAFAMCLVSSGIGPGALLASGFIPSALYFRVWFTWWLGDTAGVLVIAPLALSLAGGRRTRWTPRRAVEAALLVGLLFVAGRVGFGGWLLARGTNYPLVFVILPLLGWVALRFELLEATLMVALVCAMAIIDTLKGVGPFASGDVNESLLLLQAFIGIVTATILAMRAMVSEREAAQRELESRARQQAVVAELGRAALAGSGLQEFMDRTVARVATTLDTEMCGILELAAEGDRLHLRAAVGWPPGGAGGLVMRSGSGTLSGFTLASESPVVVKDFATETRFDISASARERGAVSGMSVTISGAAGRPYGVLAAWASHRRAFSEDDINFLQSVAHLVAATIQRGKGEEELARSNAELEQFAYAASHDLQEPLRTIASYAQLLQRRYQGRLDPNADDFIGLIVDGATRMRDLIQALLAYSRIGGRERKVKMIRAERLLAQAMSNLAATIGETGAAVTHDTLAPILGEETQLVQLFQNLLGNAIKFSGDRSPVIHVSARCSDGEVTFSVKDNGIGIDPKQLETIFLMFRRLHRPEEYPGTGVGLAICKKIVERHGGRIWAESRPGEGSIFHFTLPGADAGGSA